MGVRDFLLWGSLPSSDALDVLLSSDESREFDAWDVFDMATS
jgi:hypothetical protein